MPLLAHHFAAASVVILLVATGCATTPSARSPKSGAVVPAKSVEAKTSIATDRKSEAHAHYATAIIKERAGALDEALDEFCLATSLDVTNEALCLEVAGQLMARKQPDRALAVLEKTAARPNASAAIFSQIGLAHVFLRQWDEAIAANRKSIERAPCELAGYQNLFLNYLQTGNKAEALRVLRQASQVPGTSADFLVSLAALLVSFGKEYPDEKDAARSKAVAVLKQAAEMKGEDSLVRLKLADGFNTLGEEAFALVIYNSLTNEFSNSPKLREGVRLRLVELNVRKGDQKSAMEHLRVLLRSDPVNVPLIYQMGSLAMEERHFVTAEDSFRQLTVLRPDWEPPYYELAQAQLSHSHPREALATLDLAREKFPATYIAELLSGLAYVRLKEYDQAIEHYRRAEALARLNEPQRLNEGFYYHFGAAYERKGDLKLAEECLQKSLQLSPEFAEAQNYLGYMWADRGINLLKARELIERAVTADPDNAAYLDSLGWILFKEQKYQAALPHILKAIQLSPEPDATLLDHLGDIQAALGDGGAAREAWTKSLTLEPSEAVRKKLDSTSVK